MRKYILELLALCFLLSALLLNGCVKQPSEETVPTTTQTTKPNMEFTGPLGEGELPPVIIPQPTQPATQPTKPEENDQPSGSVPQPPAATTPPVSSDPTEGTIPNVPTDPTEAPEPPVNTEPPANTEPPEMTQPTQPVEPPDFDEDELPPIVVS